MIHDDVLGLIRLLDTKAATMFCPIKHILIRCSLLPFSVGAKPSTVWLP